MLRENVKDELAAVDDLARNYFLDVSHLARRQLSVDDQGGAMLLLHCAAYFVELALPDER